MFNLLNNYKKYIIIPRSATELEQYSAKEMQKYLSLVFDVVFDIRAEEDSVIEEGLFFVGNTKTMQFLYRGIYSKLLQDEFYIKFNNNRCFIFGQENIYSQSATLYGVYEFVERFLNVKLLSFDEEIINKKATAEFEEYDIFSKPDFIIRQPLFASTRRHVDYAAKMRIKDCYCKGTPGGTIYPMWGKQQGHNFFSLIPLDKHKDKHPEWFDEKNGQLCFCRKDLTDELTEIIKKQIIDNPDTIFFALSQNDTTIPCQCKKCKNSYKKYGVSGTLIRFINRVAKKIDAWVKTTYPGREVYLVTFAYYFSIEPPVRKIDNQFIPIDKSCIPNNNVYIFFTTIDFCFYHRLTDEKCEWNKTFKDKFYGWKSLVGERMMVWHYAANYSYYLYPFWNFNTLKENIKFFKDNGVKYILEHGACEGEFMEFQELRMYLSSKLLWNSELETKQLMDEFIDGYYKIAAKEIKQYLYLLENHFKELDSVKGGYHLRLYHLPESMFDYENFDIKFLKQLFKCFNRAFKKVDTIENETEREVLRKRVMRVAISGRFLLLMNYEKYGIKGKEEFEQKFLEDCRYCGIKKYKEYFKDVDTIPDLIELSRKNEILKY